MPLIGLNQPEKKMNTKRHKITGYKLHLKRIQLSQQSVLRSIKFPVSSSDDKLNTQFFDAIRHDSLHLTGPLNLSDWLQNSNIYSLLDFWIDSLRAGIIFFPRTQDFTDYLTGEATMQSYFQHLKPPFDKIIHKPSLYNLFLSKEQIRKSSSKNTLLKNFQSCFQDSPEHQDLIQQTITTLIQRLHGATTPQQALIWKDILGIEKNLPTTTTAKYTFLPIPEIPFQETANIDTLLSSYKQFFSQKYPDVDIATTVQKHFGLTDNFNAFQNYFNEVLPKLRTQSGLAEIYQNLAQLPLWKSHTADLSQRLAHLSDKAKQIPEPKLSHTWSDYRSSLGGKLQSWFTNSINQEKVIFEQLTAQTQDYLKLNQQLHAHIHNYPQHNQLIQTIQSSLTELQLIHQKIIDQKSLELLPLYLDLLAAFKLSVNSLHQITTQINQQNEENQSTADKTYKSLFKKIRLPVQLVGQTKYKHFQKFLQAPDIITIGTQILAKLEQHKQISSTDLPAEYVYKQLEKLKTKYLTANTNYLRQKISSAFNQAGIDLNSYKDIDKITFAPNSHSRQKRQVVTPHLPDTPITFLQTLIDHFSTQHNFLASSPLLRAELLEIEKIRWGWLTKLYTFDPSPLESLPPALFENAHSYLHTFGANKIAEDLGGYLQRFVFAEIKASISLMSRETITERYVAQVIDSEKKFPLTFIPKNSAESLSIQNRKSWGFYWKPTADQDSNPNTPSYVFCLTNKNMADKNNFKKTQIHDIRNILRTNTSKYQLQFLDNSLIDHSSRNLWSRSLITNASPSLIAEQTLQIKRNNTTFKPEYTILKKANFISLPLNLTPLPTPPPELHRYLGLDVGEYGIAYCVIKKEGNLITILNKGFLTSGALRKIKLYIGKNKAQQLKGTFSVTSTQVDRARESAIHDLRNQIHDLVTRYHAKPIYEYSISNFETGSGKISKIYHSVKTADIVGENEAEHTEKKNTWGNKYYKSGHHISSYATSYICHQCKKSLYSYETELSQLSTPSDIGIQKIKLSDTEITIYNDGSSKKLFEKAKKSARPSSESEIFKLHTTSIEALWRKNRGNSAVFICPFCQAVSDADIQAALMISLKQVHRDQTNQKEFDQFINWLQQIDIPSISFRK
ncbi:MAG: hypothetical protein KatS3mg087_0931 [Patescibacteria group bacterium]|nr:MAG: hypothetical protein KatS3mg087_0931 [Patescibacteria group bacterium]